MNQNEICQEINLNIATLNTWLMPEYLKIAKKTQIRLKNLTVALKQCEYDILALQEVWLPDLYMDNILNPDNFGPNLKYHHYFRSGVLGSGLVIFSKYPIIGIDFFKYTLCSDPMNVTHGDWYGSKGIGVCYVSTPIGIVSVYNTHLVADYPKNDYREHRIVEAFELVKFVQQSKRGHVILLGDLNLLSDSVEYQIITKFGGLSDLWKGEEDAYTFNSPESSFFTPKLVSKRIDYVMLPSQNDFEVLHKSVAFKRKTNSFCFSDHFGLHVELQLKPLQGSTRGENQNPDLTILHEAKNILEKKVHKCPRLSNFGTAYFLFSRMSFLTFLLIAIPIGYILASLAFDIQWMLTYFLFGLIAVLVVLITFLILFAYSINGLNELNRLRLEIVRIKMLLQSDNAERLQL